MDRGDRLDYTVLYATDDASFAGELERSLSRSGIPFDVGLLPGPPARMVFTVPRAQLEPARRRLGDLLAAEEAWDRRDAERRRPEAFPWVAAAWVAALIALHMVVVIVLASSLADRRAVLTALAVGPGVTAREPWRLVTSLFLHSGPPHVFWNGVSMLVFAVPLWLELRPLRTGIVYLAAGIGGGLVTAWLGAPGSLAIGSSGAVAGLFGAWVANRLLRARTALPTWRARVRAIGIALLVLPALLTPTGAYGQRISVTSHVGGLAVGLLLGWLLTRTETADRGAPQAA